MDDTLMPSRDYENFICKAHMIVRQTKYGARSEIMQNLIWKEQGRPVVSKLPSAEQMLEKINGYMEQAIIKASKTHKQHAQQWSELLDSAGRASSSEEVMLIVRAGLELMRSDNIAT